MWVKVRTEEQGSGRRCRQYISSGLLWLKNVTYIFNICNVICTALTSYTTTTVKDKKILCTLSDLPNLISERKFQDYDNTK